MSVCSNIISQFQIVINLRDQLNQEIENFGRFNNDGALIDIKIANLTAIYKIRKNLLSNLKNTEDFFAWERKKATVAQLFNKEGEMSDLDILSIIECLGEKTHREESLTKEELSFLYLPRQEVLQKYHENADFTIIASPLTKIFYLKNGIDKVIGWRDIKKDLSILFDCKQEEVGIVYTPGKEFESSYDLIEVSEKMNLENIKVCLGDLMFGDGIHSVKKLPKIVLGSVAVDYEYYYKIKELVLPEVVNGNVSFSSVVAVDKMSFPISISGDLDLERIRDIDGRIFPKSVGGNLYLSSIEYIDGVDLPETLGGILDLHALKRAKELILPKTVGGLVSLISLESLKGVTLPEAMGGDLRLHSLKSIKDVTWPKKIEGYLGLPLIDKKSIEKLKKERPDFKIVNR